MLPAGNALVTGLLAVLLVFGFLAADPENINGLDPVRLWTGLGVVVGLQPPESSPEWLLFSVLESDLLLEIQV